MMTLLVMTLTMNVQIARADEWPGYISEVKLIGGNQTETDALKTQYEEAGWTVVNYDLNKGCGSGSDYIFLLYKKASRNSTNQGYITDFYLTDNGKNYDVSNLPSTVNYNYKDYTLCPFEGGDNFVSKKGDLNSNAGGNYIHLYYTKKNLNDMRAVTDITFDNVSSDALKWNGDGDAADLNKGCGSSSPYIYMHLTTETKTNRPTTDPVLEDLVYNGAAQQLVKTPATIAVGTMYYRIGTSGSFTPKPANVTAKNAGTYTVYYYADADGVFGERSETHHQTVTISKSSNNQVTVVIDPCYGSDKTVSPSCSGNLSSGAITYQYATAENGIYTSSVPTTPGTYWVRAAIAGDNNCDAFTTASRKFMKVAWKGSGTTASPLLISSTTDLDQLATAVNGGNNFQGIVFKLTNDIEYTHTSTWDDATSQENNFTPIGNSNYSFCGTFDGAGYTIRGIRVDSRTSYKYYGAIFGYISNGAIVKDVTLADTRIYIDREYPYLGGIADKADKNSTITKCHVKDDVALFLSGNNQYGGGIVGYLIGTVSQCTSAATLSFTITGVYYEHGGITGFCKDATLTDNFVFGMTFSDKIQYIGAIAGGYSKTSFARNYYAHCTKGTATTGFGCNSADITDNDGAVPLYALTTAEGISATTATVNYDGKGYYKQGTTVTLSGGQVPAGYAIDFYTVNGEAITGNTFNMPNADATVAITLETAYTLTLAEGITVVTPPASSDGETDYYKAGTTVTLSGGENLAPEGYIFDYIVNGKAIIGNTFTMPATDATVEIRFVKGWIGDGNSPKTAYLIYTTEQLDTLAQRVNKGTDYADKYFRLMNDLNYTYTTAWDDATSQETNYTPIGYVDRNINRKFCGHFLGDGHTISGIRVYRGGNAGIDGCLGLFGQIGSGAEVSGVTLTDARITGFAGVGGIVGYNVGGFVTNCHVEADVALHTVQNYARNFGGIVGHNKESSTVSHCTSAVTITIKDGISNLQYFGGIAGGNYFSSTIKDCRAEGAVVPAVTDAGAIVGYDNKKNTILSDNTYHSCLVGNNSFNIGVGRRYGNGDMDGASLDASALRLDDCRDNTALIAAYADPASHTAYDGTAPNISSLAVTLHGRTLYRDGAWNTLCLPFDVNDFSGTPLEGATVMTLDNSPSSSTGYDASTKTLTLDFVGVNTIVAGHPYIVKWPSGDPIVNPVFNGVTTIKDEAPAACSVVSIDGSVTFVGSYSRYKTGDEGKSLLYLGAGNTIYYPSTAMTIGACRAWFQLAKEDSSKGDVNGDGQITVTDVMMLVKYILGNANDNFIFDNADINGDGLISVTDVMVLVKRILQGNQTISNIVINGADGITYGGGGTGPASAGENNLWDAEEDDPK